jgi:uncharacterized cupin superfamily protein
MPAMTAAAPRFVDVLTAALPPVSLDADKVVDGEPTVALTAFAEIGEAEVGVWEHTPGRSLDVEADEAFIVVAGRGSVTFDTGETIELMPGRLVRLYEGEQTTWTVRETLRKVYVAG